MTHSANRFHHRRRLLSAAGLVLGAIAIPPISAIPAFAAASRVFRVGFQKGGGLLGLIKAQGSLEKALGAQGWTVTWSEFPAGPQLLEALSVGSLDFGYTGAPPPIFAQAAEKDLVYVGAEPSALSSEAILVKADAPIRAVTDLKGKRVALQKGSSANFLLLAALEHAGVDFSEIEPIYLTPADARAAFETNRVDAWSIWDPYLALAQKSISVRVIADYANLLRPNAFYEASRSFATESPAVLSSVLREIAKTGKWAVANPLEVAQQLAPQIGLPVDVVQTWQQRTRYGVQPVGTEIIATQQKVADIFFTHHLIPKKVDVAKAVWTWRDV